MLGRRASISVLLALVLFASSSCNPGVSPPTTAPAANLVTISIVGTNDLHGGVFARDGRGGLPLLGGYLKRLREVRAGDGGGVVVLDAGDMFQGTLESNLSEGASVVAAYNALGYTAAAVGNHEFDFGPVGPAATPRSTVDDPRGALKARAAEASFPLLAANLIDTTTNRPVAWKNVQPTALVRIAGVDVGIIGLMTREALTATIAANVGGLSVAPLAETIRTHAPLLRARGAKVVIVTAHAGGRCSNFERPEDLTSCDSQAEIFAVAKQLPAGLIDAIIAGHTHAGVGHVVAGTPISEAMSGGRAFGRIDLVVDRRAGRVQSSRVFPPQDLTTGEYEGAAVSADAAVDRVLAPALEQVRALKARPLDVTLDTPVRRLTPESPLSNLFTDALLASMPGADVALHNASGGLRADLPAGPLTYSSK
jgi:5'-nucleotidase